MRAERVWAALIAAGATLLLVSLYLPWEAIRCGGGGGILHLIACEHLDAWGTSADATPTALCGLAVAALAATAAWRPSLAPRLPLVLPSGLAVYFALAAVVEADTERPHAQLAYGAYLGIAAACAILASVLGARWGELRRPGLSDVPAAAAAVALAAVLLLPWWSFDHEPRIKGIASDPSIVAAAAALGLAYASWRSDRLHRGSRLVLAAVAALFTVAAATGGGPFLRREYGAWVGVGLAGAVVVLGLAADRLPALPGRPAREAVGAALASVAFVATLFLPWERVCAPTDATRASHRCESVDAWAGLPLTASIAAVAAVLLVLALFAGPVLGVGGAAGWLALLVVSLGFQTNPTSGPEYSVRFAYGAFAGFGAAAVVVALVASRTRLPHIARKRMLSRAVPIAACLGYLALGFAGSALVFHQLVPHHFAFHMLGFGSWQTAIGAALVIVLLRLWAPGRAPDTRACSLLALLPAGMLAVLVLDGPGLWRRGWYGWPTYVSGGLCLLLLWLGWIEQTRGLENFELPAILRVDRL